MERHAPTQTRLIEYPESDGRPMGESDAHRDEMKNYAIEVLQDHFAADAMVYVSGNNFLYFTEGVPADTVSPDAYVVKGVPRRQRNVYKVWEEGGRVPCFALEVTSKSTRSEDLGPKMSKYRDDLKVPEYFIFDLYAEWVPERLRGGRLAGETYLPVAANPAGRLVSMELGLELAILDGHLRFFRPGEAEPLPTRMERALLAEQRVQTAEQRVQSAEQRAQSAEQRVQTAEQRALAAEADAAQLRSELDRLRRQG